MKNDDEIKALSVRQCKEILSLHRVNYSGVKEKQELIERVRILCKDHASNRHGNLGGLKGFNISR